jgi:hypothetical protein
MDGSIIRKIVRDCFRWDHIVYPRTSVLTVAHDNDRSLFYRGRWYSPIVDTIEDDLHKRGVECVSIARIISRIKGDIAYGRVFSPEGAFARALVIKRALGYRLRGAYPYSGMEEAIWGRILDETGARKVIGIQPSRELCVASRKRGIWVADVQHGVIAESHPWYGQRYRGDDPMEHLPNAFVCWDLGSQQVIDRWAASRGVSTLVTGNRWVARFLQRRHDDVLVGDLFRAHEEKAINPTGKPTILVALSWGEVNIPNSFMIDSLRDVIRNTADRYHWFVRLHPNQLNGFATQEGRRFTNYFRANLDGFVDWEVATRSALPLILHHTDLHICWNSSVAIEASQIGIRSALLDPRLRSTAQKGDYFDYYRRAGMIDLVEETRPAIERWIEANLRSKAIPENFDVFDASYASLLDFLVT